MIKNLIQSVLHIVGSENLLRQDELNLHSNKTIAEILDEEKTKDTQNHQTDQKESEK